MSAGPVVAGLLSDAAFHLVQVEMGLASLDASRSSDLLRRVAEDADVPSGLRALAGQAADRLDAALVRASGAHDPTAGAAGAAGVEGPGANGGAQAAEAAGTRIGAGPRDDDEVARAAAREAGYLLERAMEGVPDDLEGVSRDPGAEAAARRASSGPDPAPSASTTPPPPSGDPELLEAFTTEALEALDEAERAGLALEANGPDAEALNAVFRCFHTLKGTAAFLDLEPVVALAHSAESLLGRARAGGGELGRGDLGRIFATVDQLRGLVSTTADGAVVDEETWRALARDLDRAAAGAPDAASAHGLDAAVPPTDASSPVATAWTRVRTDRLDKLVDAVGELVIAHAMVGREAERSEAPDPDLGRRIDVASAMLRELQDLAIAMRMVPVRGLFQRVARQVSDLARRRGAGVTLLTEGEDTEIDRNLVELVADPLLHMVRNAVDHGLEAPEDRAAAGKPERGTLVLCASSSGGNMEIRLTDDGRGLDRERIRERARKAGLAPPDRELPDDQLLALITMPGFSTSARVTEVSGRGVGMDVVRRNVEALRGTLSVASVTGQGCTFTIRLPLTLAVTEGMLARIGDERFVLPTSTIRTSVRPAAGAVTRLADGSELLRLGEQLIPLVRLHELLGVEGAEPDPTRAILVVAGPPERPLALLVDELLEQIHVVAKPISGVATVPCVSGAAVLGDGRVGLILDIMSITTASAASHARVGA